MASGVSQRSVRHTKQPRYLALQQVAALLLSRGRRVAAVPLAACVALARRLTQPSPPGRVEMALARAVDALERAGAWALTVTMSFLGRRLQLVVHALVMAGAQACAMIGRRVQPIWAVATEACVRRNHQLRRHWMGRHVSNGTGAAASYVAVRVVVRGGPVLGSLLFSPARWLWSAVGLYDLRFFFALLVAALCGVLRLYRWLGWI